MFRSDLLFATIVVVLLVLPFLSLYPSFEKFPYDSFFSALTAVSVVILAWERIADGRGQRLQSLMRRVYLDHGEFKLFKTLTSISKAVAEKKSLSQQEVDCIMGAAAILRLAGRYHRIDYLYPRKGLAELEALLQPLLDYDLAWQDIRDQVEVLVADKPELKELVYHLLRRYLILEEDEAGDFLPYIANPWARAGAFASLNHEEGRRIRDFVESFRSKQARNKGIHSPIWGVEIIQRISTILGEFGFFVEKHGIPAPGAELVEPRPTHNANPKPVQGKKLGI